MVNKKIFNTTIMNPVIDLNTDFEQVTKVLSNLPYAVGWKDYQAQFLCINHKAMSYLGIKRLNELAGLTIRDAKSAIADLADQCIANDLYVMQQKKACKEIISYYDDQTWKLNLILQQPLFDYEHKVVGVSNMAIELTNTPLAQKFSWLFHDENNGNCQGAYKCNDELQQWQLSDQQADCLFFLLRGKKSKEISQLLNISTQTVASELNVICYRFGVMTISELIEKARHFNLQHCLPAHWSHII